MATINDIRALGYSVDEAFASDGFMVYRVSGFGVSTQVRDNDADSLTALADRTEHDEAVRQQAETVGQTRRRWVREKRIPPPNVQDVT